MGELFGHARELHDGQAPQRISQIRGCEKVVCRARTPDDSSWTGKRWEKSGDHLLGAHREGTITGPMISIEDQLYFLHCIRGKNFTTDTPSETTYENPLA